MTSARQPGSSRPAIVRWGDSLTQQGDDARLSALTRAAVINRGVGGETSSTIAARMGALPTHARILEALQRDAHEARIEFTAPRGFAPLLQGSGTEDALLRGWLEGVPGTVFRVDDAAPAGYVFLADEVLPRGLGGPVPFIPHVPESLRSHVTVIWVGRNNPDPTEAVVADIAAMVAHLRTDRYLILSVLHGEGEGGSTAVGGAVSRVNDAIASRWAPRFVDVDAELRRSIAGAEFVPAALRKDAVHLNSEGQRMVSDILAREIIDRRWLA